MLACNVAREAIRYMYLYTKIIEYSTCIYECVTATRQADTENACTQLTATISCRIKQSKKKKKKKRINKKKAIASTCSVGTIEHCCVYVEMCVILILIKKKKRFFYKQRANKKKIYVCIHLVLCFVFFFVNLDEQLSDRDNCKNSVKL